MEKRCNNGSEYSFKATDDVALKSLTLTLTQLGTVVMNAKLLKTIPNTFP